MIVAMLGVLGRGAIPVRASSPITSESVAVLLVSFPSYPLPIRVSDVAQYSLPFLNDWYGRASYGAFRGFKPAQAASVTKSDGISCDRNTMLSWAVQTYPSSAQIYVVVVPSSACPKVVPGAAPNPLQPGHYAVFYTDQTFVHTDLNGPNPPSPYAVYSTVMEIGHSLLGLAHANALDCTSSFSWDCYTAATSAGGFQSGGTCAERDGTVPYSGQICEYGDPWDAMGNDFPESANYKVGTIPGDAWLNGIELDKVGWLAGREAKPTPGALPTPGVSSIRPLEDNSASGAPQALWIPGVPGSTPMIEMEYRHPAQSPSPFSRWLDGFLNGCVAATVDCGWPKVTGGLLLHAALPSGSAAAEQNQSLLIDATPDSNLPKLCPSGTISGPSGVFYNNAFCDWYDAAVQPGLANSFVPDGPYVAPYYVTVLSAGASGASVAVNVCPCQDAFSPSSGDFGRVAQGASQSITFTVTNSAVGVTHTISNPTITGSDASAFSIVSNNCGALAPGAACQVTISFNPSGAGSAGTGQFTATLALNDTNPVFPTESVTLSGTTSVTSNAAWAWGYNRYGELGDGTSTGPQSCPGVVVSDPCSTVPAAVSTPAGVTFAAVSMGEYHSLALDSTGHAWAWGDNTFGELGNATTTDSSTPVAVSMPAGVRFTAVSAGLYDTLALDSTGRAWAWGINSHGELGNGTTANSSVPVAVSMPAAVTFTAVSIGGDDSLALDSTGHAWAWGDNREGQLGNGNTTDSSTPVEVCAPGQTYPCTSFLAGVTGVSMGLYDTLALDSTGRAWAWGDNNFGELGIGTQTGPQICPGTGYCSTVPVAVSMPAGITFTSVSTGEGAHDLALDSTGQAWAWGYNGTGQLGIGTTTNSSAPVAVSMPAGVSFTAVSAGSYHSLALDSAGQAWAWGDNSRGALGNGTTTNSSTPVAVSMPAGVTFTAVSTGAFSSLALHGGSTGPPTSSSTQDGRLRASYRRPPI